MESILIAAQDLKPGMYISRHGDTVPLIEQVVTVTDYAPCPGTLQVKTLERTFRCSGGFKYRLHTGPATPRSGQGGRTVYL